MLISHLVLKNFRNYSDDSFTFGSGVTVIEGKNGIGKTNILEAIYVLTHGKSWKTRYDYEMVEQLKESLNIKGSIKNSENTELFVGVQKGFGNRSRKVFKVNDVNKSYGKFVQVFKSVLFSPHDLEIILGSPSERRRFLNEVLAQVDEQYAKHISDLKKIVTSRNKILKRINLGEISYDEILYWNQKLIESSNYIHSKRKILVEFINEFLKKTYKDVSNTNGSCFVKYIHKNVNEDLLVEYKAAEIASKRTLLGAQKDDFLIIFKKNGGEGLDSKYFASRGEQRTLVFVLKLASLDYLQQKSETQAVLLLDDIYSELDEFHRKAVGEYFNENQVIITTAEKQLVPKNLLDSCKLLEL
jgi:DNA replication and repair protein RecF